MDPQNHTATLYGIEHSNRKPDRFWGKNEFNSCFPIALSCYMRDRRESAVGLLVGDGNKVVQEEFDFDYVFNSPKPNKDLEFVFESGFEPYSDFSTRPIGKIDVVIKDHNDNFFLRPLEIKLTVVPDSTTVSKEENKWSSELVVRPASTSYLILGLVAKIRKEETSRKQVQDILNTVGERICGDWRIARNVMEHYNEIHAACLAFQKQFRDLQEPFLLQPIWKTQGHIPELSENALDVFVWTDMALAQLFLDKSKPGETSDRGKISRAQRETIRFFYALFEGSANRRIDIQSIYREMHYGTDSGQSDKAFAASGSVTHKYMACKRLREPVIKKGEVKNIILNGGERKLNPERRFDQTIYYTMRSTK